MNFDFLKGLIADAAGAVGAIKEGISLGKDVTVLTAKVHSILVKGEKATPEDRAELRAQRKALEDELEAEPPPEQP